MPGIQQADDGVRVLPGQEAAYERYLREVTVPTVTTILERHGRSRQAFRLVGMPFIAVGETDAELDKAIKAARKPCGRLLHTAGVRV